MTEGPTTPPSVEDAQDPADTTAKHAAAERPNTLRQITESSWLVVFCAIVAALVLAGVLVAGANAEVQRTAGYIFSRPQDFFGAAWDSVSGAYSSLFRGAVFDAQATSMVRKFKPITETLAASVPLLFAGLGIGIGFRAGMFNIGAQGQVILGAIVSAYVGFAFHLPIGLHVTLAVFGGLLGGAIWGGIAEVGS